MTMQHLIEESVDIFMSETERADKSLVRKYRLGLRPVRERMGTY